MIGEVGQSNGVRIVDQQAQNSLTGGQITNPLALFPVDTDMDELDQPAVRADRA